MGVQPQRWLRRSLTLLALLCVGVSLATVAYVERSEVGRGTGVVELPARIAVLGAGELGIERWRRAAERNGIELEPLAPADLDAGAIGRCAALVVHDDGSIDETGWERIERGLEAGRGLVLVDGRRPRLERLFPGAPFRPLERAAALRTGARGPLVAGLDPGTQLAPPSRTQGMGLDGGRSPLVLAGDRELGAALEGQVRGTPVVWLALDPARLEPAAIGDALIANALRRVARRPLAHLRAWPDGANAAAVVGTVLDGDPEAARRLLAGLRHRSASVVFALPDAADPARAELARRLGARAEIAHAAPPEHGPGPVALPRLEAAARRPVTGLWSDVDLADADALVAEGYRYVTTARLERAAPLRIDAAGADLVALPRTAPESIPPRGPAEPTELVIGRLLGGFAEIEARGGIYVLRVPDDWQQRSDGPRLAARLLDELAARRAWISTGAGVAAWWRRRARLELELHEPRLGRAELTLENRGAEPVQGATARVYLPPGARPPTRVETAFLAAEPTLRIASDRSWMELVAPRIPPGARVRYAFRY